MGYYCCRKAVPVKGTQPIDYPHVHKLYTWTTSSKGGGWFLVPTNVFVALCLVGIILYFFFHHWTLGLVACFFYGAWLKRQGMKEGFVLGYEAGHNEASVGKKDFSNP
jgi:hypothetical protein